MIIFNLLNDFSSSVLIVVKTSSGELSLRHKQLLELKLFRNILHCFNFHLPTERAKSNLLIAIVIFVEFSLVATC